MDVEIIANNFPSETIMYPVYLIWQTKLSQQFHTMISSLDVIIVVINYASHQLTLGKKMVHLPKLPHMAKMYSQLPDLG